MVKNVDLRFLWLELKLADQVADLPPTSSHLVANNGNFRFLLLELILADQLSNQPSPQ